MASQPPSSGFPSSMGPGARSTQPGESPRSMIAELQEIRSSYFIKVDSDALHLAYNFRGANRQYDIPFNSMPLSDGSRWLLYGGERRARVSGLFALDLIRGAENMAGRPLTQQEAEAFAFHTGKRMKYNYGGTLVGFAAGYLIAARTWKTMKFPFIKPKPIEAYDYFPAQRLPLLRGAYSRIMWQITRANIYAAISLIFAQTISGSMGDSVMTVGLYRDVRTQDVVKAVKGGFDRIRMNRSQTGQGPPMPQQQQGHDEDPAGQDFYGNEGKGLPDFYGKSTNYSGDQTFSDATTDTGALDDPAMRRQQQRSDARQYQYTAPQPAQTSSSNNSNSDYFFDDASPTAGNGLDPGMAQSYPSGGGSAWDSIRRGQRQPQQPPPARQQQNSPQNNQSGGWRRSSPNHVTTGDSFSFSKSDEDRQLAKQQAQKEFDAMLEKERRDGGSEGYASSSYAAESGAEVPQNTGGSAWNRRRGENS